MVECLTKVNHDDKTALSQQCRRVVHTRQVLADKDIRLNPRLEKNCKNDITNLCFKSIQQFGQSQLENVDSGISLDGVIIQCLKDKFVEAQSQPEGDNDPSLVISKRCSAHVERIMADEAKDFELDPQLAKMCKLPLGEQGICSPKRHTDPIECLKTQFMDEQLQGTELLNCRNYIGKLIREAQVDMEVDATLQNACAIDIKVSNRIFYP